MKKFDLENLPDLKIRVANSDENERIQKAFYQLGYNWGGTGDNSKIFPFDKIDMGGIQADMDGKKLWNYFSGITCHVEITLAELEALAAEKCLQESIAKAKEAQTRYDAAVMWLEANEPSILDDRQGLFSLENHGGVQKALRIASGMELQTTSR